MRSGICFNTAVAARAPSTSQAQGFSPSSPDPFSSREVGSGNKTTHTHTHTHTHVLMSLYSKQDDCTTSLLLTIIPLPFNFLPDWDTCTVRDNWGIILHIQLFHYNGVISLNHCFNWTIVVIL